MGLDLCKKKMVSGLISFEYIALLDSYFIHGYIIIKHRSSRDQAGPEFYGEVTSPKNFREKFADPREK